MFCSFLPTLQAYMIEVFKFNEYIYNPSKYVMHFTA